MHTLHDEMTFASSTKHVLNSFDNNEIIIVPEAGQSVTHVAQRLGLLDKNVHVTGDVRGQADGWYVIITADPAPYLADGERQEL